MVLTVGAAVLLGAAPASALTRYASPTSVVSAGPCTDPNAPCTASAAVAAGSGNAGADEVILASGTYPNLTNAEAATVGSGDVVHAAPGGGQAAIPTSAKFPFVLQPGSTLRDVSVIRAAGCSPSPCDGPTLSLNGARAERVYVQSDSGAAAACGASSAGTSIIRDSVCWSESTGESAVEGLAPAGQTAVLALRNVTAVNTTANSTAVMADGTGAGTSMTVFATNVIAVGDSAGTRGDVTSQEGAGATVRAVLDHSNFDDGSGAGELTSPGTNFNVSDPPVFLDAADGDFRQDTDNGSTIDRGTAATVNGFALGALDLDGAARCLGPAPDIGAYEAALGPPCPTPAQPQLPAVQTPTGAPAPRCKKGQKLKRGKCVRKKKKKKRKKK
jgi:hypothetical protein